MGALVSEEMKLARRLILDGNTPYAAAKVAGISQSAITKSKWNRDRVAALRAGKMDTNAGQQEKPHG